jgi:hypothetical protein
MSNTAQQIDALWSGLNNPTNGKSWDGALIQTFEVGTSTPKAVWEDRDKTLPSSVGKSQFALDSNGQAEVFGDGVYKISVYDPKDTGYTTPLYTIDGAAYKIPTIDVVFLSEYESLAAAVTAIGATETELWIDTDAVLTASLDIPATLTLRFISGNTIGGAYTLTFLGSVENILAGDYQIFESNIIVASVVGGVNVKWFGATGDGTTDDYDAVERADNAGTAYFSDGVYRISQNLTLSATAIFARNAAFSIDTGITVILATGYGTEPKNYNVGLGTLSVTDTNVAYGDQALRLITSGTRNTAIGATALRINTTGGNNTALGVAALNRNVDGIFNAALGSDTLQHNTSGSYNTAVGRTALLENTTGSSNVAVGSLACTTQNASRNTAVGTEALHGYNDLEMLDDPDFDDIAAQWTTSAGTFPAGGWAVGSGQVEKSSDGTAALWDLGGNAPILAAVGLDYTVEYEITDYTAGSVTVSFGGTSDTARSANGSYSFNVTASTTARLAFTPTNTSRFAITSASKIMTSSITGDSNTAIGIQANYFRAGGTHNTAIGETALLNNYLGDGNVALGYNAGKWYTGDDAFFVDNQDRVTEAGDLVGALLYGEFNSTPASQLLNVNGTLKIMSSATIQADSNDLTIANPGTGTTNVYTNSILAIQIINDGEVRMPEGSYSSKYTLSALQTAPASAGATGTTGEIRYTADHIYVCVATNTWKRVAIATW